MRQRIKAQHLLVRLNQFANLVLWEARRRPTRISIRTVRIDLAVAPEVCSTEIKILRTRLLQEMAKKLRLKNFAIVSPNRVIRKLAVALGVQCKTDSNYFKIVIELHLSG